MQYLQLNINGPLYLENGGGGGTACAHWEENTFRTATSSELMTGFFEADLYQPISKVTVGALDDLGVFELDYSQADEWPTPAGGARRLEKKTLRGGPNGKPWKVLKPKSSFRISELMKELPPAIDLSAMIVN
mmetsp:Transcript_15/g.25  ORF Transcript_15/g.25 Transcript_15/m.25 type:complete len:132 (+) Transcript_15:1290-1685(+)